MEHVRNQEDDGENISFDLFSSYFNKKFVKLEEKVDGSIRDAPEKKNIIFKYKGNEIQYDHNKNVMKLLREALKETTSANGDPDVCKEKIQKAMEELETRNKHILIADSTSGGWDTVREFVGNKEISANSDEEKKITAANNRAVSKKKQKRNWPKFRNAPRRYYSDEEEENLASTRNKYGRSWKNRYNGDTYQKYKKYSSRSNDKEYSYNQSKGVCFSCGSRSHWREYCPYSSARSSSKKYSKKY